MPHQSFRKHVLRLALAAAAVCLAAACSEVSTEPTSNESGSHRYVPASALHDETASDSLSFCQSGYVVPDGHTACGDGGL
jgi:hypothetical protein